MSQSMLNMYVSFGGMVLLIVAMVLIELSRRKFKGILSVLTALIAYTSFLTGGLIILYIVFSGPTG